MDEKEKTLAFIWDGKEETFNKVKEFLKPHEKAILEWHKNKICSLEIGHWHVSINAIVAIKLAQRSYGYDYTVEIVDLWLYEAIKSIETTL